MELSRWGNANPDPELDGLGPSVPEAGGISLWGCHFSGPLAAPFLCDIETHMVRRGKKWFRYDAPDKQLFKQLQKTLTTPE